MSKRIPVPPADLGKTEAIICVCGNHTFTPSALLRKISAIMSPNGEEAILPVPVFTCNHCGRIPDDLMPEALKEIKSAEEKPTESKIQLVRD